jgi:hypothetical protein
MKTYFKTTTNLTANQLLMSSFYNFEEFKNFEYKISQTWGSMFNPWGVLIWHFLWFNINLSWIIERIYDLF